jgi:hypothetical protein
MTPARRQIIERTLPFMEKRCSSSPTTDPDVVATLYVNHVRALLDHIDTLETRLGVTVGELTQARSDIETLSNSLADEVEAVGRLRGEMERMVKGGEHP